MLLPSIRESDPDDVVLADGFSCRTQIHELDSGGKEAIHLAELLSRAQRGEHGVSCIPKRSGARLPRFVGQAALTAGVGALLALALRRAAKSVGNQPQQLTRLRALHRVVKRF